MALVSPAPIVDLATAKSYLVGYVGTAEDPRVEEMIDYVTGRMETYCARWLMARDADDLPHDGTGSAYLYAKQWPVSTVTAATIAAKDGTSGTRTPNITGYSINYGRVIYSPLDVWDSGVQNVLLSATYGYDEGVEADLPKVLALRELGLEWLQSLWQKRKNAPGDATSISLGGGSVSFQERAMPISVERGLAPFRRLL